MLCRVATPAGLLVAAALVSATPGSAELPIERPGRVETLELPHRPHWVWIGDALLRRSALVDADSGRMLGILPAGFGVPSVLFSATRPELYVPETHYSRGTRGERSDVLTIYDAASLAPSGEVVLPPKRGISALPVAHAALSDDDRFAAIFNLTPATSLSVVDLERRAFVAEISTPGCSLVYPAGPRRFASLCMDGALMLTRLDEAGREAGKQRSVSFFDPERDPVTEKAARWGRRWLFVSFEGFLHGVDLSGDAPDFDEPWRLTDAADREEGWRVGGSQHLAVHQASGRLYALMHRGGPDTHKQPGVEVWVYDLDRRERVQRIELESPGFTYLGVPIDGGDTWGWLVDWIGNRVMRSVPELGVDAIAVTQDAAPLLVTVGAVSGGMATYDALTGEFRDRLFSGNMTSVVVQTPSGRTGAGR